MVPSAVFGWPGTPQGLPLLSLKIQEMQLTPCVSSMEGRLESEKCVCEVHHPVERAAMAITTFVVVVVSQDIVWLPGAGRTVHW